VPPGPTDRDDITNSDLLAGFDGRERWGMRRREEKGKKERDMDGMVWYSRV